MCTSTHQAAIAARSTPGPGGCWLWKGTRNGAYGTMSREGKNLYAHRVSFEAHSRPLRPGEVVCHRCDVPLCVNPAHLFAGSYHDNAHDCIRKGRWSHGVRHGGAVLDDNKVRSIRARRLGGESTLSLAEHFGVSTSTIRRIVARTLWEHVT